MLTALIYLLVTHSAVGSDIVVLPDGTQLQGVHTSAGVTAFKGVPYAAAPVDDLRWAPPQPWTNPDPHTVLDATEYGSPCKQTYFDGVEMGSEDCLFLNVWVDSTRLHNTGGKLPVAVYIHGGSYMSGMGNDIEGSDFVNFWLGSAIVVSMNYRLNVFGFSGSAVLRKHDKGDGSTGNYGLQDQRQALIWIHENIRAFGGDPQQVMIFGESAGAGSVSNHLAMPRSTPYFSSAIMESGSFIMWITQPMWVAEDAFASLLQEVQCDTLECLLALPTQTIYNASLDITSSSVYYGTPYNPTVDGIELLTHPWIAASAGNLADVTVLHGTNTDEGSMFLPLSYNVQEAGLVAYWSTYFTLTEINSLLDLYVRGKNESSYPYVSVDGQVPSLYWWAGQRALADADFYCGAKYGSQQIALKQKEEQRKYGSYLYWFDYLADGSSVPFVQHTNEIPFVFHDNSYMASDTDSDMADIMAGYWGAFIEQNGSPNGHNVPNSSHTLPLWRAYDLDDDNLLALHGPMQIDELHGVRKDECDFFIPWMDVMIRKLFSD